MEEKENSVEGEKVQKTNKKSGAGFFKSKVFLTICSFICGALIMFLLVFLTTGTPLLIQKVIKENVKTTTLEEVSDLKKAINTVYAESSSWSYNINRYIEEIRNS